MLVRVIVSVDNTVMDDKKSIIEKSKTILVASIGEASRSVSNKTFGLGCEEQLAG